MVKSILRLISAVAIVYVGVAALLWWRQRELLFPASRAAPDLARAALPGFSQVSIATPDGESLVAWWKPPANASGPVILFLHGNAGSLNDRAARLRVLTREGAGLLLLAYRGYGGSTGTPSEAGLRIDALAAYDWIGPRAPGSPIILYGESLGTAVAVRLAGERKVAGVVLDAGFTSAADVAKISYWWLPVDWLMIDRFPSEDRIKTLDAPLLSLHGDRDEVVPFVFGNRLFTAAPGPKRFVRIEGGRHMENLEKGGLAIVLRFVADPMATVREAQPQAPASRAAP